MYTMQRKFKSAFLTDFVLMGVPGCRWDLDQPWSLDNYIKRSIIDSVNIVASALDKVIKECLGDPLSPRVITQTLEKNVWNSTLRLSAALNSTPVQVVFDDRAHRVLPMALGNLVNGTWKVAGVYDPNAKQFTERSEIIIWPKTGKLAPRAWMSCTPGERLISPAGERQHCEACDQGTFSVGGRSTVCEQCAPGERAASVTASAAPTGCRCKMPRTCRLLPARARAVRLHRLRLPRRFLPRVGGCDVL